MKKIRIGIVGATGLVAGELIRLLLNHSFVDIDFVYSHSKSGQSVIESHPDLLGRTHLQFTDIPNLEVDLIFLCLGHGNSIKFLKKFSFSQKTRIIDLSNDFRLKARADFQNKHFIYGLPELNYEQIKSADYIANPGCFATAIQLALLPLAANGLLSNDVHIHALTGATGAGKSFSDNTHFIWRTNNLSVYKAFTHQHLDEIIESIRFLQKDFNQEINFIPMRGDFSRGIFVSAYLNYSGREDALHLFKDFYKNAAFTIVSDRAIYLKQVVNTNNCIVHVAQYDRKIHITSTIDNLLKGASGQAVQNMNLMFGFEEKEALVLKPSAY